jgi:hypothetical protein
MVDAMKDFVPDEYYLSQNYPDPFSEKTTIKYCLPENVKVKLELFDSEKRKIKTLVDEIKEAGTYQVELKANGMKEGIYFYRLIAGSFESTKRMLLVK